MVMGRAQKDAQRADTPPGAPMLCAPLKASRLRAYVHCESFAAKFTRVSLQQTDESHYPHN